MPQKYGLSETEYEIMNIIWEQEKPLFFHEIMEYFNTNENKSWKKQTLHTYLSRLIKKGALMSSNNGYRKQYQPALSKTDYISKWTSDFLSESFDGSLNKFMSAFTGNNKLSKKDLDDLRKYLNSQE